MIRIELTFGGFDLSRKGLAGLLAGTKSLVLGSVDLMIWGVFYSDSIEAISFDLKRIMFSTISVF